MRNDILTTRMFFLLFFTLTAFEMCGQSLDTITRSRKLSYKSFIFPALLTTGGIVMINSDLSNTIQDQSNHFFGKNFKTGTDNFLPFVPIAQIYMGPILGFKPKDNVLNQTIDIVVANSITLVVVEVTKNLVRYERPDHSNNFSFPSGHTAISFTTAALLYHQYRDSNLWYASSGFLFATATGILRIANNKHFAPDVITGAGIGLASGLLVSYYNPFRTIKFGKNRKTSALVYPQIGNQIGIGLILKPE
ncbi:phosphatase PAP2 family protein [Flavobacterium granuli]|uniref:phosphatase PAP2 family protein n=1 Tax=Flavobacterium granuli TaxID=280093 RepID=UPI001FCD0502|nr:phosphatase PAP2 family protein [Flavobacterium granuli]